MQATFIFSFVVPVALKEYPFSDSKTDIYINLKRNDIKAYVFECSKGYRVITVGSTRRKVERVMFDLNGRHLRTLDEYTFSIVKDYISGSVLETTCI